MDQLAAREKLEQDVLKGLRRPGKWYLLGLAFCTLLFVNALVLWGYQASQGLGVAGIMHPVGWGVYIANFVFWVGIAHSGTLISAVLYLFRARFRTSFNRTAEAMTIFALMVAGMFPLIHLGRVEIFYYLFPYPNQRNLWPNFRSPLVWDVFAITTYLIVSLVFFYVGTLPDLAIVRRRLTGIRARIYSFFSLGWTGSLGQWKQYSRLYLLLAAFATPLVASVHSIVSWDFAVSILPGWHTTIFAPYFVAGAIFSGTAMVIILMVPLRRALQLPPYISIDHFEAIAKILLFTSLIISYAYLVEYGLAFYGQNQVGMELFRYRALGHYRVLFWLMIICNSLVPLTLFIKRLRRNLAYLFVVALLVNLGMWIERFILIVTSLARDFDPYAWGTYTPSWVEIGITFGSFGLFFMLILLFVKTVPVLSMSELKERL